MAKRSAAVQISDRNPYAEAESDSDDDAQHSASSYSSRSAQESDVQGRRISRPRSLAQRSRAPSSTFSPASNSSSLFAGLPTNPFTPAPVAAAALGSDANLNMRGLNKSFLQAAQEVHRRNPAADFTRLFEQYQNHLASFTPKPVAQSVASPLKTAIEPRKPTTPAGKPSAAVEPNSDEELKPIAFTFQASKPEQPKSEAVQPLAAQQSKPALFPGLDGKSIFKPAEGPSKASFSRPNDSNLQGFSFGTPTDPISSAFSFPPPASSTKQEEAKAAFSFSALPEVRPVDEIKAVPAAAPAPFSFGAKASEAPFEIKPFTFGTKPSAELKSDASSQSTPFTFSLQPEATVVEPTTDSKPFAFGAVSKPEEIRPQPSISAPLSPSFSLPKAETSNAVGAQLGADMSPAPAKPFSFSFGASTAVGLTPDKPALPAFSFGTAPAPGAFSFSFSQPSMPVANFTANKSDNEDNGDDGIPADEQESFNLTRTTSEALKTGAGEENEAIVYEQRCKVFLSDREKGWVDLGVVVFKINRDQRPEATGQSRILCRVEGSGRIVLNARITALGTEATPLPGKKEVALLAFSGPDGKPQKYLIRVKTLEEAGLLQKAIQEEVAHIKENKK